VLQGVREGEQVVVAANFLIDAESNLKAAVGGLGGHAGHGEAAKGAEASAPGSTSAPPVIGLKADGSIDGIDLKAGTVSLSHGPIAALKWPAMTMEFKVAHGGLLQGLQPGQAVAFEFVERQPGEYVVTSITAAPAARAPASPAMPAVPAPGPGKTSHSGH
jgi:Cu(I)/Ag(I) efflux system membrane fusion protein